MGKHCDDHKKKKSCSRKQKHWVATWGASPVDPNNSALVFPPYLDLPGMIFNNQTIRNIVHISLGGSTFRVRLSNIYSYETNAYATIGSVHIALRDAGASIIPGSDRQLTFNGKTSVVVPPNAVILSDPVKLDVPDFSDLAISIFLPLNNTFNAARHLIAEQTSYIAPVNTGDNTANINGIPFTETTTQLFYISDVEVLACKKKNSIVCFGDSITDGNSFDNSTLDTNTRYPDFLASRLKADHNMLGVTNAGITLCQLLYNIPEISPGVPLFTAAQNGLARFDTDALTKSGAKYIIVLIGGNDIGLSLSNIFGGLNPYPVTFEDLTGAYIQLINRAHEMKMKIYGGTLTPPGPLYAGTASSALRQQINEWIRTSGKFDAVIDFDLAVRDPHNINELLPAYNSGDGLHPNSAGYQAMANIIDLNLFRENSCKKSCKKSCNQSCNPKSDIVFQIKNIDKNIVQNNLSETIQKYKK